MSDKSIQIKTSLPFAAPTLGNNNPVIHSAPTGQSVDVEDANAALAESFEAGETVSLTTRDFDLRY